MIAWFRHIQKTLVDLSKNLKITVWTIATATFVLLISMAALNWVYFQYLSNRNEQNAKKVIEKYFDLENQIKLLESTEKSSHELSLNTRELLTDIKLYFNNASTSQALKFTNEVYPITEDLKMASRAKYILPHDLTELRAEDEDPISLIKQSMELYEQGILLAGYNLDDHARQLLNKAYVNFKFLAFYLNMEIYRNVILYALGHIGIQLWDENKDMEGALFLIELIRSSPNSRISKMAWTQLNSQIHFGYSGSSGDHTPRAWQLFLSDLKNVAFGKINNLPAYNNLFAQN